MAFWPALLLARSARLPWALRGLLAGAAVLLAAVALLSQSRGSLYATPVMLVAVFAFLPGADAELCGADPGCGGDRRRGALGAARRRPPARRPGRPGDAHHAVGASLVAAVAVAVVVALAGAIESRRDLPAPAAARLHRATGALALAALVLVIAGGLIASGNPVRRIEHGWQTFKGGYSANSATADRLVSGLGSSRYDFYRVALDEFVAHPLAGIGADNFQQQYLVHGRSTETPRYPHSVELRTLAQTGILGTLLALAGLAAALIAAMRAVRGADPLGRAVAAAALGGFAYWVVHGSFDWFWEFAGLGGAAFALLGLACALAPGAERPPTPAGDSAAPEPSPRAAEDGHPGLPRGVRVLALAGTVVLVLLCALSFAGPWLSQLEVERAARIWRSSPASAYGRLRSAARLNPLSDEPYLVSASIALRLNQLGRATDQFNKALSRTPEEAYATLELGVIASFKGERTLALARLERAVALAPREPLGVEALRLVRQGRRLSVRGFNRAILYKGQQFS